MQRSTLLVDVVKKLQSDFSEIDQTNEGWPILLQSLQRPSAHTVIRSNIWNQSEKPDLHKYDPFSMHSLPRFCSNLFFSSIARHFIFHNIHSSVSPSFLCEVKKFMTRFFLFFSFEDFNKRKVQFEGMFQRSSWQQRSAKHQRKSNLRANRSNSVCLHFSLKLFSEFNLWFSITILEIMNFCGGLKRKQYSKNEMTKRQLSKKIFDKWEETEWNIQFV